CGHCLYWQIKIWRVTRETITVKTTRRNSDHTDWFGVHPESAPHDRSTAKIITLPCCVAHYGYHGCAFDIIRIKKEAPGLRLQAKGAEVVARDELSVR